MQTSVLYNVEILGNGRAQQDCFVCENGGDEMIVASNFKESDASIPRPSWPAQGAACEVGPAMIDPPWPEGKRLHAARVAALRAGHRSRAVVLPSESAWPGAKCGFLTTLKVIDRSKSLLVV